MNQMTEYPFAEIERSVQQYWQDNESFKVVEDPNKEKFYCLAMFPYPSGRLHIGHVRNYAIADAIARYQRQKGKNVLHPIGWDSFGLPAENAAIENGVDPREWTEKNIANMRRQLRLLGMSYDWGRELSTCEPDYYRWEQWFFTRLYQKNLVYRKLSTVNWDPVDKTVLANEQVVDGCGWRSGAPVEQRSIKQWFVRITDYAEELLDGLNHLPQWPERVVQMQKNWIGKSTGAHIRFALENSTESLEVFTTRADTVFGVVALVLAPSHPLVQDRCQTDQVLADAVEKMNRTGHSEQDLAKADKQGHPLSVDALHPLTQQRIPLYVGNYVLAEYGSGVVMSVPAHDQRDYEFAQQFQLSIIPTVLPTDDSLSRAGQDWTQAYVGSGTLVNSDKFDGLDYVAGAKAITEALAAQGAGDVATTYRLRDWGVSRQRYWGCPIPIEYQDEEARASQDLPVVLPKMPKDLKLGEPWSLNKHPDFQPGQNLHRETDTLDTFFESSWYYARYCSHDCAEAMLDARVHYWLPVDQYVGGIEHAVLHLLYFRFFHKLMRDEGLVEGDEPATRLLTQGMVVGETWSIGDDDSHRQWVSPDSIEVDRDERGQIQSARHLPTGKPAHYEGMHKMSKSKNNGVDPEQMVNQYGSDAVRLYILFAAPPEQSLEWSSANVSGCTRFLRRLYDYVRRHQQIFTSYNLDTQPQQTDHHRRRVHSLLQKALYDYDRHQFNTIIAVAMEMMNIVYRWEEKGAPSEASFETLTIVLRLLAPIAPHLTFYLWQQIFPDQDIQNAPLPVVDPSALVVEEHDIVIQINNRKRGMIQMRNEAPQAEYEQTALAYARDHDLIDQSMEIVRVVVVAKKLVNMVCRPKS